MTTKESECKSPQNPGTVADTAIDVERGGQITFFTKPDCTFCERLKVTVEKCVEKVLAKHPQGALTWKTIECKGANASLCVRLTGSFSVPHIFFNDEYIGDCSTTCKLAEETDEEKNVIMNKLTTIALGPKMTKKFPPSPDASIIRIAEDYAFSSQPSNEQLAKLGSAFSFGSVVNLLSPMETSYVAEEEELVRTDKKPAAYIAHPLVDLSENSILTAVNTIKFSKKPALIHCDTGQRALMIALLLATEGDVNVEEKNFEEWGKELSIDMGRLAAVAFRVALKLRVTNAKPCCESSDDCCMPGKRFKDDCGCN